MLSIFRRILSVLVLVALLVMDAEGQAVNSYARVTAISTNTLTLSNTAGQFDYTNHTFAVGEPVVIMQMQGTIPADTATGPSTSNWGTLGSIGTSGQYEVKRITAITTTSMTLNTNPTNTYTFNNNSSVQVISMQELSAGNYTTTAQVNGVAWNGFIGGVIALNVPGTLTLNHNIVINGGGFRGGAVSVAPGDGGSCQPTRYASAIDQFAAGKGEGIFRAFYSPHKGARARSINGGGGGNVHNAGGAGGGNNTAGGDGGIGYSCTTGEPPSGTQSGGIGGLSLGSNITFSRVFMGGGGGGGHQNNNSASAGGNGGGIVLILANTIATTGSCTARRINVNGDDAANTIAANGGNDGAGGGGAGGTVVFQVANFNVVGGCPMTVRANGGNGGTVNAPDAHGGGGSGGAGKILFSSTATPTNVTSTADPGTRGCSNSDCSVVAGTGGATGGSTPATSGSNGSGPLPVSLVYFTGAYSQEKDRYDLQWATATEISNKYFTLQRSTDGTEFTTIAEIDGNGTTNTRHTYSFEDKTGFESAYYYRLYQTDLDGKFKMLGIIHLTHDAEASANAWAYPNPVNKSDKFTVDLVRPGKGVNRITLFDMQGRELKRFTVDIQGSFYSLDIDTGDLPVGVYTLVVNSSTTSFRKKVVVK